MNADDPQAMSADEPPDDINVRIEQVTQQFLSDLQRGSATDIDPLVSQYPELAPYLESRLRLCRAIFLATRGSKITDDVPLTENDSAAARTVDFNDISPNTRSHPFAFRIRCPHCGHLVQVIDEQAPEVTCHSCGSSVKVTNRPKPSKRSAPPMPERLGHFQVLRVLGEGGFGIVYLGRDSMLDRLVAIKVPRNGFFASVDEESRFFREAKHVAQLKHAHIAQVYEISDDRFAPFIASEFIDGMTLRDHAKNRMLTFKEMAELMVQVAEAIEYAHQRKIIHRDLKTSNILVGPGQHAFVVDFGLSRRDDVEMTITVDGALIGTLQYMSPEQAAGQANAVGPHSDVYSLGVILYELLCNELPFHGTKRMLIDQVIHDEPRAPRRLNENVPKDLETIALKAMAKKAEHRYVTARDLADDLNRWLRHEPIRARPVSSLARGWSWCRRHPTIASLTALVAALLLLVTCTSVGWALEQARLTTSEKLARTESEHREYQLLTQNGLHALEQNNLAKSAFWLSEALSIRDTPSSRIRLGMIQDRLPKLVQLWPTGANIDILAFDRTGQRVATASYDGRIQVFDLTTRRGIFDQTLPKLSHVELSPNGEQLIVCGSENHAQLWDVSQVRLVRLLAHTDVVVTARFHPVGDSIATGSFDGFVRIWNAEDGRLTAEHKFDAAQVTQVEFLPGNNQAIVITHPLGQSTNKLYVWHAENDQIIVDGLEHDSAIISLRLFDEGKRVNCATRTGQITRWQLPSGEPVGQPLQLPATPSHVFFEAQDRLIATSDSMQAQAWDLKTGQPFGSPIRGHSNLAAAATDPAHNLLALGSSDGWLGVLWQQNGATACDGFRSGEQITQLVFHPDSRQLAVGGRDGVLTIWDLAGAAPTAMMLEHNAAVRSAIYSRDGSYCFTVDTSGQGRMWNTITGQKLDADLNHEGGILDCWLSADGKVFITAGADNIVRMWNAHDGSPIGSPLVHESPVSDVVVNSKGDLLISGCQDGTVSFWTIGQVNPPQHTIAGKHDGAIAEVAFNPSGDLAISTSTNGELLCWDTSSKQSKYGRFPRNASYFYCGFMPDGQTVFTCDAQNSVKLWNLQTQKIIQTLPCIGAVNMALPYESGQRLITCETSGAARLWHDRKGSFELQSVVQDPAIQSMRWATINAQENYLALSGGIRDLSKQQTTAGAILLWDLAEERPLAPPLLHLDFVRRVAFHPQGHQLLTASSDKTARLWSIVTNELPASDAVRMARLIVQLKRDDVGRTGRATAEEQGREFDALRHQYPAYFACNAEDVRLWEIEVNLHRVP